MFALALALFAAPAPGGSLVTAHAVRESDGSNTPVVLTGVVTFAPNPPTYFFLSDATGGVRVEWKQNDTRLHPGDVVRVTGKTTRGTFLPFIEADTVGTLKGPYERAVRPQPFNLTPVDGDYLDGDLVEAEAVVERVWTTGQWLKLDLARGRGQAVVYVPLPLGTSVVDAKRLRGSAVRVRGVWERVAKQGEPSRLLVQEVSDFVVTRAPVGTAAAPPHSTRELTRPRPDPVAARLPVRLSGTVVLNLNNRRLFVRDDTGTADVILAESKTPRIGERVTVAGFPRPAAPGDVVRIDNAVVVRHEPNEAPQTPAPGPGTVDDAVAGKLNGQVVKFRGTILGTKQVGACRLLSVLADGHTFTVAVLGTPPGEPEPGGTVEASGTVVKEAFQNFDPTAFVLFAPPRAVALEPAPPPPAPVWWTGARVAYLSAGFVGLLLLTGASATVYRSRSRRGTLERGKLERQLERAARLEAVGQLAGGVIHDFNNVLTVITGAAEVLRDDPSDPTRTAALAGAIGRAGEHGTVLARQLLNVVRQRTPTLRPLDLNTAVADTAGTLVRLMGDRVAVRVNSDPNLPPVLADGALLLQIVLNLAVNARDAMPSGGTFVLATTAPAPGTVRLTASDTGTGMTPDVRDRAFDPGFTTKEADKGTGLGLFIVARSVETLGGTVRVRSEPTQGTTFEIDLPAAARA